VRVIWDTGASKSMEDCMKKKRFTEEQIVYTLAQETGGELAFPSKLFIAGKRSLDRWALLKSAEIL